MLLLGLALAVAEEWIIQQTSIAPLIGLAKTAYGRVWGVNLVYFLWALGYESVWVVLIPIQLTELLFPMRRASPWLRTRGLILTSIAFLLGAFMAWYGWTQRARIMIFHMPPYTPPRSFLLGAFVTIVALVFAAYTFPSSSSRKGTVPSPWIVLIAATLLGTPWAAFVLFGFGSFPAIQYQYALAAGIAWCILTFSLFARWTSCQHWSDRQRLAVTLGGTLACSLGGFIVFKIGGALRIDWIGKTVIDGIAVLWLGSLGRKLQRRLP